ncbi:hypothetical protein CEW46_21535 [Bacillus cereus]|nr:hypothetical protein CEW46_21535 [Bacillus cereus]
MNIVHSGEFVFIDGMMFVRDDILVTLETYGRNHWILSLVDKSNNDEKVPGTRTIIRDSIQVIDQVQELQKKLKPTFV